MAQHLKHLNGAGFFIGTDVHAGMLLILKVTSTYFSLGVGVVNASRPLNSHLRFESCV
jgi:hypothetical protein